MANNNITTIGELRDLLTIADALAKLELSEVSFDKLTISDVNGEQIAEYRYVGDYGYTFVFNGQEYTE